MRNLIRSNSLRLIVLFWFAGWLLLVMPGHKRGIVTLPGGEVEVVAANRGASCCEVASDNDQTPAPIDPAKHCAICFLKSHLTDPPAVTLYTPYLGELDELTYLLESSILDQLASPYGVRGRAPPA